MPRYLSIRSKNQHTKDESNTSTIEDSSSISSDVSPSLKKSKLTSKAANSVKRQLRRLDDLLHHVTHTKHEPTDDEHRRRTVSVPSPVPPHIIPSLKSTRSRSNWNIAEKFADSSSQKPATTAEMGTQTEPEMSDLPKEEVIAEGEEEELSSSEQQSVLLEADAPDPFLMDEEGDAESEAENEEGVSSSAAVSPANILLDMPPSIGSQPPALGILNVNKDVPPPPENDQDEDEEQEEEQQETMEEEFPDLYVPGLILPTMFLPIPNTDPLTTLLNKYIYPPERRPTRDLTGEWTHSDFHTLVMTNSWRALAKMAQDRLVSIDPSDLNLILGLWHLRLSCLARLRLFNQASAECTNLFSVLTSIEPPESRAYVFDRILPFELEVMHTRLKYWAGDHMGYLDALTALLKKCRLKCREATRAAKGHAVGHAASSGFDESAIPMWKERGARVALIMASQLVEMKELTAAVKLLEPLASQREGSPALLSSIARIYLQAGYLQAAKGHFDTVEKDSSAEESLKFMNKALLATAEGAWVEAADILRDVLEKDSENLLAMNNLAVALLNQTKPKEAIEVLERALQSSPSAVVVAEPFLFNLSTLYELRATVGMEKKKELLVAVSKWSGDGLRTNCLKMPAN